MFIKLLIDFLLSFIFGYFTMSLLLKDSEKVGVIFVQENDFDLPEQNSK
jgi:hypothetical protein